MSEAGGDSLKLRLKLKLPQFIPTSSVTEKLRIGARGGAAVKELLSTAPNIEVAIRDFQAAHGVAEAHAQLFVRKEESKEKEKPTTTFTPAMQLLDLLQVPRSSVYQSLLDQMKNEMLLRIADLPQSELPRVLEQTFPYIEFRELRSIPIAVLAKQEETPELYLRELTENRRILAELPVHVKRKILQVDRRELQLLVEKCTREFVTEQLEWYLNHPTSGSVTPQCLLSRRNNNNTMRTSTQKRKRSLDESAGGSLWNVSSHVPSSADATSSSLTAVSGFSNERRPSYSPDERRRNNPALMELVEMLGDSEALYLSTLEIWRGYVMAANIPGSATNNHPKEYVDYVSLLGAMRSDLANLQRDKTTTLLRTDPLHKFIWFLDRAVKNQTLEIAQLHELLGFIGRLRTSDLPANKKFRKKSGVEEEEESFEVVLGPPPVDELLAVLDKITKIDARLIFAEPVPDDVPKYREIVKDPMDLSTMRRKAKRGKYKTLDGFVLDFNLMIRNCMTFNPDTSIFYKEGKRIGKRGIEIIERNAVALRGEPQRIRTKKRRKTGTGPTSEAVSMLTSSGTVTIKDFGDVDQSGMIPEGLCDEQLADVALVLSDPLVKQLICDALMKNLVVCWQRKELPTDNSICRALVQLLQIGNPSSVRRMIRKQDFVLRAPQVITMRVVLPLLLRTMISFRIYYAFPVGLQPDLDSTVKQDVLSAVLWDNVLRASSAIRAMAKSFAVQCLVDRQIDAGSQLLHHLLSAEDESLLRDRVFLHAVTEVVLEQVKLAAASTSSSNGNDVGTTSAENGEVTMTLSEQLQALEVWKQIVDGFFVCVLAKRIQAAKEETGFLVHFVEGAVERVEDKHDTAATDDTSLRKRKRQRVVQSFPTPAFHEKTVMMLSSLFATVEQGGSAAGGDAMIASYLKKTLGVLRSSCFSLEEFEALWSSPVFAGCRHFYEPMLTKLPDVREELFAILPSDVKTKDKIATEAANVHKENIDSSTVDSRTQGSTQKLEGTYTEGDAASKTEGDAASKTEGDAASKTEGDAASKSEGGAATKSEGDAASKSEGDAATKLEGEAASKSEGEAASKSEGDAASKSEEDAASRSEGDTAIRTEVGAASRSEGDATSKSEGDAASKLEGDAANKSEGDAATKSEGDAATKSEGDAASKSEGDTAITTEVCGATKSETANAETKTTDNSGFCVKGDAELGMEREKVVMDKDASLTTEADAPNAEIKAIHARSDVTIGIITEVRTKPDNTDNDASNLAAATCSPVIAFNVENPETDAESIAEPNSSGNDMDVTMEEVEEVSELKDSTAAAGSEPYTSISTNTPSAIAATTETSTKSAVPAGKAVNADNDEESIVGSSDTQNVVVVEPTVEKRREETKVTVEEKKEAAET
ncbi:unnamed protein product [Peronospora effusa]|uniref:Bromo domain-containing protein n=1 Tax=Peronospora effusa TaxID=542832 RepID=A0A425CF38_9STRA|nr:hypothetical protein DD237_005741 [Peronospora effusa]CAI5708018.1 unnamed protein product [Peronospora effusa]